MFHANINQSLYSMKLKKFLNIDTAQRIKYFENFFKEIKTYSHENPKITDTFEDVDLGKLVDTVVKDFNQNDGICCLNSHIAYALQKMIIIQSGK